MLLYLIDLNVSVVQVVTDAESAGVRWSDDENFGDAEVRKEGGVFCFPFVFCYRHPALITGHFLSSDGLALNIVQLTLWAS